MCIVPTVNSQTSGSVRRSLYYTSLAIHGPRLFNFIPATIRNMTDCSVDTFNHFRTIGRYRGPAHYILSIRQAAMAAIVTSSFKIFLTPRCGATCYILPWRAMSQLFNGVNFGYRSAEVYRTFHTYLQVLVRIRYFHNGELRWRFDALYFRPFIR